MKLFTKEQLIIQATNIHCNLYDYSKVQFPVKLTDLITIIDPVYGEYTAAVGRHLRGKGHPVRGRKKSADANRKSVEIFIQQASKTHNNLYDYSKVIYENANKKVCIIDPEYGEFWQTPAAHAHGQGHPTRGKSKMGLKRRTPLDKFVSDANKVHNNLYDYSKVEYQSCDKKVCIIDPVYGEFWQTPYQHLRSHGCPARTKERKWLEHIDHIIPLSIIRRNKVDNKWYKDRPLYKFLNSEINLQKTTAKFNVDKSDFINVNGKMISASSIRNNYDIIGLLIQEKLNIDPSNLIDQDKKFIKEYFGL